jgi:translation initiation factor IF-3
MFDETNPKPWSKILTYSQYFYYQTKHREKKTGNPPIINELEFFNKSKIN